MTLQLSQGQLETRAAGANSVAMSDVREYESRSLEVADGFPRYHDWLMRDLLPHVHGRVLEVGAGVGTIAERWVDRADVAVLVEPAKNLHAKLAARFTGKEKVHALCGLLDEVTASDEGKKLLAPGTLDVVIMVNVLEHIEQDLDVLRSIHALLRPGGHLLIFVPALQALYGAMDKRVGHVRRYDKRTLTSVVQKAGLEVERLRYFDFLGMAPWFLTGRVLKRETVGDASGRYYDKLIVPVCDWIDGKNGPFVGKNLICVAARR